MESVLHVFLTVDVGPADAILGKGHEIHNDWQRTDAGVAVLRDIFRSVADQSGNRLDATWFLRADRLIEIEFGDRLSMFRKFSDLISKNFGSGHEIGWMPQVYSAGKCEADYDDLYLTHAAICNEDVLPFSVRMGDCFHDNRTMNILNNLGVVFDSSAVPGRKKVDAGWRMDWIGTPNVAYHPSVEDYRTPGKPCLEIMELPLSVLPIMAPYDSSPILRYLNPCMHRTFFWQNMSELIASCNYLLFVLHPDEVVAESRRGGHPLIAYSADELNFNLQKLVSTARTLGRVVSFHTIKDFFAANS